MATVNRWWYILFLACIHVGCIRSVSLNDTSKEQAGNSSYTPEAIQEYNDSIVSYTITVTPPKIKGGKFRRDTVRKVTYYQREEEAKSYDEYANAVRKAYLSQIGVVELTGHNDGAAIEKYLAAVHLNPKCKCPYCSAGVGWSFMKGGVRTTINAYSPSSVNFKNLVYTNGKFKKKPHYSDVVSFYYAALGRIGHTGFYDKDVNDKYYESVEFNTSGGKGITREGGGVYRMKRSWNATQYCSRWIPE